MLAKYGRPWGSQGVVYGTDSRPRRRVKIGLRRWRGWAIHSGDPILCLSSGQSKEEGWSVESEAVLRCVVAAVAVETSKVGAPRC